MRAKKVQIKTVIHLRRIRIIYGVFFIAQMARSSAGLKAIAVVDDLMVSLQVACFLFCFWDRLYQKKISWLDIGIIAFYVSLFISTVMTSRDYFSWTIYAVQGVGTVFLIENMLEENEKNSLIRIRNVSILFLLCNILSMILLPSGFLSEYYFLGSRIGFTPFCIFAVSVSFLCDYVIVKKKSSLISCFAVLLAASNLIMQKVSTGIIGLVLFGVMLLCGNLLNREEKKRKTWIYAVSCFIPFIVWGMIIWGKDIGLFQSLLKIVGEDMTFNGRMIIWQTALEYISRKPLWGYGVTVVGAFYITAFVNNRSLPAHDELLNLLYQGGLITFFLWNILFFIIGNVLVKCKEKQIVTIISAMIFSFLCIMITEIQSQKAVIFMVLALACQIGKNHVAGAKQNV